MNYKHTTLPTYRVYLNIFPSKSLKKPNVVPTVEHRKAAKIKVSTSSKVLVERNSINFRSPDFKNDFKTTHIN